MGIALGTVLVLLFLAVLLFIREKRHKPRNFQRAFPGFHPTLATHRGYGKHGPIAENTIPAFLASEKLGFHAHELDVRRTADGAIVLLHGPRLENTTDGSGRMEDTYFSELQKLNAAAHLRDKKARPVPIPTLKEVFSRLPPTSTFNVEIKRDRWDFSAGVEDGAVRVTTLENAEHRVYFSGFHFMTLWNLRKYRTGIPIGLLIEPWRWARLKLYLYRFLLLPDNIHLHYSTATPELMASLKKRGYGLAFWTVNDEAKAQWLFDHGADVVITDRMEFIQKFAPAPKHKKR